MKMTKYIIFIWLFTEIQSELINKEIGANCKTNGDEVWTCQILSKCPQIGDFRKSRPDICGFLDKEPIICCPSNQNDSQSPDKTQPLGDFNINETVSGSLPHQEDTDLSLLTGKNDDIFQPSSKKPPYSVGKCIENEIKLCIQNSATATLKQTKNLFSFVIAIGYGEEGNVTLEGAGTLISEKWILGSAYCANSHPGVTKWAAIGFENITEGDNIAFQVLIVRTVVHPFYDKFALYHDVALFKTEYTIGFNIFLHPACLHPLKVIPRNVTAAGFKMTIDDGIKSWSLRNINIKASDPSICEQVFNNTSLLPRGFDEEIMICAGETEKDTCMDDYGSPLFIKSTICLHTLLGIVPFGRQCGSFPGVFTRVSYYVPWIESIVWPESGQTEVVHSSAVSGTPSGIPEPRDVYKI